MGALGGDRPRSIFLEVVMGRDPTSSSSWYNVFGDFDSAFVADRTVVASKPKLCPRHRIQAQTRLARP